MSLELKITAPTVEDLHRQVIKLANEFAGSSEPAKLPKVTVADFPMHEIVQYLASQGFALADAEQPPEAIEEAPKKTRRKKAEAQPVVQEKSSEEEDDISAPVSSVSSEPEGEEIDLDALKSETIDRLQELYFVDAGVPIVDAIRKRHAGKKKFSDLPKELFVQIAAELNEALERANA